MYNYTPQHYFIGGKLVKLKYTPVMQKMQYGGTWVAQSVKHQTLAQVMISRFLGSSPTSGSVLTAQSPEPPSDSVSPSLSAHPPLVFSLSLSLSQKLNKTGALGWLGRLSVQLRLRS